MCGAAFRPCRVAAGRPEPSWCSGRSAGQGWLPGLPVTAAPSGEKHRLHTQITDTVCSTDGISHVGTFFWHSPFTVMISSPLLFLLFDHLPAVPLTCSSPPDTWCFQWGSSYWKKITCAWKSGPWKRGIGIPGYRGGAPSYGVNLSSWDGGMKWEADEELPHPWPLASTLCCARGVWAPPALLSPGPLRPVLPPQRHLVPLHRH